MSTLTKGHQAVADLLERNPQAVLGTAAEVGRAAGVNASTVVRYAIASGYSGWTELQQVQRSLYLAGLNATDTKATHSDEAAADTPFRRSVLQDLSNVRAVLEVLSPDVIGSAAEALATANRIAVAASGSFAGPATVLGHLLSVLGLPAQVEDRGSVHLGALVTHLKPGDCFVTINLWRQTTDLVTAAQVAHEQGVHVIAVTDTRSGIAEYADTVLLVPSESSSFFQSTTASMSAVYGLVAEVADRLPDEGAALAETQASWDLFGSLGPLRGSRKAPASTP